MYRLIHLGHGGSSSIPIFTEWELQVVEGENSDSHQCDHSVNGANSSLYQCPFLLSSIDYDAAKYVVCSLLRLATSSTPLVAVLCVYCSASICVHTHSRNILHVWAQQIGFFFDWEYRVEFPYQSVCSSTFEPNRAIWRYSYVFGRWIDFYTCSSKAISCVRMILCPCHCLFYLCVLENV